MAFSAHLKGWNFLPKYCSTTDRNLGTPHSCTRYFMRACECVSASRGYGRTGHQTRLSTQQAAAHHVGMYQSSEQGQDQTRTCFLSSRRP